MVTQDLEKMGRYEIDEACKLLTAYKDFSKLPIDWQDSYVRLMFNTHSGAVFFTNDESQVLMLTDDDELQMWYILPYSGVEGFYEDLIFEYECNNIPIEDYEDLATICHINGHPELYEKINNEYQEHLNKHK